jgi:hypothetical protein
LVSQQQAKDEACSEQQYTGLAGCGSVLACVSLLPLADLVELTLGQAQYIC